MSNPVTGKILARTIAVGLFVLSILAMGILIYRGRSDFGMMSVRIIMSLVWSILVWYGFRWAGMVTGVLTFTFSALGFIMMIKIPVTLFSVSLMLLAIVLFVSGLILLIDPNVRAFYRHASDSRKRNRLADEGA